MDKKEINQQEKEQAQQETENIQPSRLDFIRELISDCRYDDAVEMLQIATEDEPDNVDYNYELARIFMEMGNYHSAISNLELTVDAFLVRLIASLADIIFLCNFASLLSSRAKSCFSFTSSSRFLDRVLLYISIWAVKITSNQMNYIPGKFCSAISCNSEKLFIAVFNSRCLLRYSYKSSIHGLGVKRRAI